MEKLTNRLWYDAEHLICPIIYLTDQDWTLLYALHLGVSLSILFPAEAYNFWRVFYALSSSESTYARELCYF